MLLAIDPGACSGWALFDRGVLAGCGIGDPPRAAFLHGPDRTVIEHPMIYPGGRTANPNAIVKLAINAGEWGGRYKAQGSAVDYVLPATWKGTINPDVCNARVWAKLTPAEQALVDKAVVAGRIVKSKRHNMLDAIGIGLFAVGRAVRGMV